MVFEESIREGAAYTEAATTYFERNQQKRNLECQMKLDNK